MQLLLLFRFCFRLYFCSQKFLTCEVHTKQCYSDSQDYTTNTCNHQESLIRIFSQTVRAYSKCNNRKPDKCRNPSCCQSIKKLFFYTPLLLRFLKQVQVNGGSCVNCFKQNFSSTIGFVSSPTVYQPHDYNRKYDTDTNHIDDIFQCIYISIHCEKSEHKYKILLVKLCLFINRLHTLDEFPI